MGKRMIIDEHEYEILRNVYQRMKSSGVPVLFDSLSDFIAWSKKTGFLYGRRLRRRDKNLEYSPDNCVWVDVVKAERYDYEVQLQARKWDEFVKPIRERFRDYLQNPAAPPPEPKPKGRECFRYEHPDLVREGICFIPENSKEVSDGNEKTDD